MNVLAMHLSCAMVHLNMHVQGDSLKMMNLLVTRCPALIARHASTLLTNFLNLISRKVQYTLSLILSHIYIVHTYSTVTPMLKGCWSESLGKCHSV